MKSTTRPMTAKVLTHLKLYIESAFVISDLTLFAVLYGGFDPVQCFFLSQNGRRNEGVGRFLLSCNGRAQWPENIAFPLLFRIRPDSRLYFFRRKIFFLQVT